MTRFAIDAGTAIRIVRDSVAIPDAHQLVAPKSLQSQALAQLYREVRAGSLDRESARETLDGITTMRIRLLGDRVSRGHAWRIAEELGWDDIGNAEYIAVAKLQADAFVTLDEKLAREVAGIVPIAPFEELTSVARS
jgi:predicted nucleic acid-binding protein